MLKLTDILKSEVSTDYGRDGWLPSLDVSHDIRFASIADRVRDAWAVFKCRAVAVKWPHQDGA